MKRAEFTRRTMEMLSQLMPEQRKRLLDQLEAYLWMMNHLGMWDEKRTYPWNRIITRTRVRDQERTPGKLYVSSPSDGHFS